MSANFSVEKANPVTSASSRQGRSLAWVGRSLDPARVFLVLVATFGLAVLLANGPWQAPDENDHFFRSFQLSEGGWICQKVNGAVGGYLPAVANKDMGAIPFHYENKVTRDVYMKTARPIFVDWPTAPRVFTMFPHTSVYPVVSYIPQTAAIRIGRWLHLGPLVLLYLARLASFGAAVWLGYQALRILPVFRWSALVMLLCPMGLYLFGSAAPDGVLIGAAWLLVALVFAAQVKPTTARPVAIALVAAFLAVAKTVYLPLAVAAIAFVFPRLLSRRQKGLLVAGFVLFGLIPMVWWWGRIVPTIFVVGRGDIPIDPHAQTQFILHHPLAYVRLVTHTLWDGRDFIYHWAIGTLGWGDTPMPDWYFASFGWALLGCVLLEAQDGNMVRWTQRWLLWAAAAATVLLILTAQYLTWNRPGALDFIDGVEGRYFLPVAPFVIVTCPALLRWKRPAGLTPLWATTVAAVGAITCLVAVIYRYYVA